MIVDINAHTTATDPGGGAKATALKLATQEQRGHPRTSSNIKAGKSSAGHMTIERAQAHCDKFNYIVWQINNDLGDMEQVLTLLFASVPALEGRFAGSTNVFRRIDRRVARLKSLVRVVREHGHLTVKESGHE